MRALLFAPIAFAAILACSPERDDDDSLIFLQPDITMPAEDVDVLRQEVAAVNAFADYRELRLIDGPPVLVGQPTKRWLIMRAECPGYYGLTQGDLRLVRYAPWLLPEDRGPVMRHELGHVIRMDHVPEWNNIMSNDGPLAVEWGDADRRECRRVGVCR